jgi:hypothetical protein
LGAGRSATAFLAAAKLWRPDVSHTFKVVEVDSATGENFGTYVAKLIIEPGAGQAALRAYQCVRSHTAEPGLCVIFETAGDWQPDSLVALEGDSWRSLAGL